MCRAMDILTLFSPVDIWSVTQQINNFVGFL
jgi:hypothetical protein